MWANSKVVLVQNKIKNNDYVQDGSLFQCPGPQCSTRLPDSYS